MTETPPDTSGHTHWSRTGFANTFKRKGRKKTGSDTTSIASVGIDPGKRSGSISTVSEEGQRRNSNDQTSTTRKLATVLKKKLRKINGKEEDEEEEGPSATSTTDAASHDPGNGSDPLSHRTLTNEYDDPASGTMGGRGRARHGLRSKAGPVASDEGLLPATEDSDNFTDDSDIGRPTRPTLSPHPSHAGYLTLSSPLIPAETLAAPASPLRSVDSVADTRNNSIVNTLPAPAPASRQRSYSPVGRLKEAFNPTSKKSATKSDAGSDQLRHSDNGGLVGEIAAGPGRKARPSSRAEPIGITDRPLFQESVEKTPSPRKTFYPQRINTDEPATPPHLNGPATVVTPPTPIDSQYETVPPSPSVNAQGVSDSPIDPIARSKSSRSAGSAHRRNKSSTNTPSKLFNSMTVPLTPATEEVKTPGGTLTQPQGPGGFFSSMFSAAQNAATNLTSTITSGAAGQRNRSGTGELDSVDEGGGEEVILAPGSEKQLGSTSGEKRQLAVETLGSGNLSLSHLGISEPSDVIPMNSSNDPTGEPSRLRRDELQAQAEDDAAARAVSIAYSEQHNGERTNSMAPGEDVTPQEAVPVRLSAEPETGSIKRAGSVRSRLSGRRRRTRGSSVATGNTTVTPTIAGPAGSTAQRLTGFAVANPKRNRDFHNLFRSVPEDDYLIEDYSAALQREILLHGRLYVSEGHICFSSNILGWVTNLVMSFDEVISVEKRNTAVIFQNGLVIQTLQARNVFASLLNRESTYELIISIWKITHPNLKSSLNGAPIDGQGTGDRTEKAGSVIEDESASEEVYDEDEEDEDDEGDASFMEDGTDGSAVGSESGDAMTLLNKRKVSAAVPGIPLNGGTARVVDAFKTEAASTGGVVTQDFPGPAVHDATDCGDVATHYDKVSMDVVIPAPLGKIYSIMFGPASGAFMRKWLIDDQKSIDLQLEDDKKGLGEDKKTMSYSYIKPLSGPIGPKQTKCVITQTLEQFDLKKAVTVVASTLTPDVPSGNVFVVKTKYCLMWAPGNATKIISTFTIEWSGKSWLKGPIEKGANEGQLQYGKDLSVALRAAVTAKAATKGARGKGKAGRRKKDSSDPANGSTDAHVNPSTTARANEPDWGLLEPLRGPLGPLASLLSPEIVIGALTFVIIFMWWRQSRLATYNAHGGSLGVPGMATSQRIAAYEEMWRGEESDLWQWLEERVGLDGAVPGFLSSSSSVSEGIENVDREKAQVRRRKIMEKEKQLVTEDMSQRQMLDAIRVTKERLQTLEDAVMRKKGGERERADDGGLEVDKPVQAPPPSYSKEL